MTRPDPATPAEQDPLVMAQRARELSQAGEWDAAALAPAAGTRDAAVVHVLRSDAAADRRSGGAGARAVRQARIAVLGSSTTSLLIPVLRALCFRDGIDATFHEGAFGAFRQEILERDGPLAAFKPSIVIIAPHWRDIELASRGWGRRSGGRRRDRRRVSRALVGGPCALHGCHVIQHTFDLPADDSAGLLSVQLPAGPPTADSAHQSRARGRAAVGRVAARHRAGRRRGGHRSLVEPAPLVSRAPASLVRSAARAGGRTDGARARRPRAFAQGAGLRSRQHAVERASSARTASTGSRSAPDRPTARPTRICSATSATEGPRHRPGGLLARTIRTMRARRSATSAGWCCGSTTSPCSRRTGTTRRENLRRIAGQIGVGLDSLVVHRRQPDRARLGPQPASRRSPCPSSARRSSRFVRELDRGRYFPAIAWSAGRPAARRGYRREQERAGARENAGNLDDFLAGPADARHVRARVRREHRARHPAHEQDQPVQPHDEAAHARGSPAPRRRSARAGPACSACRIATATTASSA